MDHKEFGDLLADKLEIMKKDINTARQEDQAGFDAKLKKAFEDLQKETDANIIELKESLKPAPSTKALSFSQAFAKSVTDQKDEFSTLVKSVVGCQDWQS